MEGLMRMGDGETSYEMSQITVESAEMVDDQGGVSSSNPEYLALESMPTQWTNEMHYLYLKSMEESFVNQLHCSMGFLKRQAEKYANLEKEPSEQNKTLRDGSWKNAGVTKYGDVSETIMEPRALKSSPWIRHFRQTGKNQVAEATVSQDIGASPDEEIESKAKVSLRSDSDMKQVVNTLSRQDSVFSNTEMSGQNFIDNGEIVKSSGVRHAKRRKTETTTNPDNDQEVPFKDFTTKADSNDIALNLRKYATVSIRNGNAS